MWNDDSRKIIERSILPTEEAAPLEFFAGMRDTVHVCLAVYRKGAREVLRRLAA